MLPCYNQCTSIAGSVFGECEKKSHCAAIAYVSNAIKKMPRSDPLGAFRKNLTTLLFFMRAQARKNSLRGKFSFSFSKNKNPTTPCLNSTGSE
jgi:hypothetical protein